MLGSANNQQRNFRAFVFENHAKSREAVNRQLPESLHPKRACPGMSFEGLAYGAHDGPVGPGACKREKIAARLRFCCGYVAQGNSTKVAGSNE